MCGGRGKYCAGYSTCCWGVEDTVSRALWHSSESTGYFSPNSLWQVFLFTACTILIIQVYTAVQFMWHLRPNTYISNVSIYHGRKCTQELYITIMAFTHFSYSFYMYECIYVYPMAGFDCIMDFLIGNCGLLSSMFCGKAANCVV